MSLGTTNTCCRFGYLDRVPKGDVTTTLQCDGRRERPGLMDGTKECVYEGKTKTAREGGFCMFPKWYYSRMEGGGLDRRKFLKMGLGALAATAVPDVAGAQNDIPRAKVLESAEKTITEIRKRFGMGDANFAFELRGERLFVKIHSGGKSSDDKNEYYVPLKGLTSQKMASELEDIAKFFLTEKFNIRF